MLKPVNKPLRNPMLYDVKSIIKNPRPQEPEKEKKKYRFFQKNIK
jgi:hypothetical protein